MGSHRGVRAASVVAASVVVLSVASAGSAFADEKAAFVWPQHPSKETLDKAAAMGGERGLVVVERRCALEIRSYNTSVPGVTRDEFIRLLVTSDDGARNAKVPIGDQNNASIDVLEGRTIAPDGTITALDDKKDVVRVSVSGVRSKETTLDLATVSFPAPVKGSILDLHFVTTTNGPTTFYYRSLVFEWLPVVSADFDVALYGGLQGIGWSVMTLGETFGAASSDYRKDGHVVTHLGAYTPPEKEPLGLPSYQWEPLLLCYLNLATLHGQDVPKGQHRQTTLETDGRGLVKKVDFSQDNERAYWRSVVDDFMKVHDRYVKSPGSLKKVDIEAIAPASLPVEERVQRLHGWVREHVVYYPDAEQVDGAGDVVKKGMTSYWQATMVLSYLLDRAGIPKQAGIALNRYGLRFSPVLFNSFIFPANFVLKVDVPDKPALFLMEGLPPLPAGSLPDIYQEGLVLFPSGEKDVAHAFTRANPPGVDVRAYGYTLELDPQGDASGAIAMDERGSPAVDFSLWNRQRTFREAHPKPNEERSAALDRERAASLEKALKEELVLPGDKLQIEGWRVAGMPDATDSPLKLWARIRGKGLAQRADNRWLLYTNPLMVGYANPFVKKARTQPVWHSDGAHVVLEGEIKLPAGAAIVELPKPTTIDGPENTHATSTVTKVERGGALYVRSRIEYDRPPIVARESYAAWSAFQSGLASLAGDRCVITMPESKELE